MKTLIVFLLTNCSLLLFSQTNSNISTLKKKIAVAFTPEFNDLIVSNALGEEKVQSKIGVSTCLILKLDLTNNIRLRTGFGYGKKKI
jgi:hypothetical protein